VKSIDKQIKDLREALGDTIIKLSGFDLIEAGVAAEDMETIKMGLKMAEGVQDSFDKALDILNGDEGEA